MTPTMPKQIEVKIDPSNSMNTEVERASRISQIQDLFPELGDGFVTRLLACFDEDVERATAALLDESLPAQLKDADRKEVQKTDLPIRRNIYDDDDLDELAAGTNRVHLGRKNDEMTADDLMAEKRPSGQKAAIWSALAAFDADDDERDDTYDVGDVGGSVDNTLGEDTRSRQDETDLLLFSIYQTCPERFQRDAATRRSKERAQLKADTQLTDEALEGWALVIGRDKHKQQRLAEKAVDFRSQPPLVQNSWPEDEGSGSNAQRQRPTRGKSSHANHSRRNQRAKKMARGGFSQA